MGVAIAIAAAAFAAGRSGQGTVRLTPAALGAPVTVAVSTTTTSPGAPALTASVAALGLLDQLRRGTEGPRTGYDRNKQFGSGFIDANHDGCNARREVLIAESTTPVRVTQPKCTVSGTWVSLYDGVTTTDARSLDIDHLVPLGEAWDSGASAWDKARRKAYANNLDFPDHLIAVTAHSNRSKGDKDPAQWKPESRRSWCRYAISWTTVKIQWELTADDAEVAALRDMLATC
jgi:hypothetical protein